MNAKKLGRSALEVPPLCFGGNVFGWTADEKTSFQILDALWEVSLNFIDTADVYSVWAPGHHGGESEVILGKWLKQSGKRHKMVIATKAGMMMSPEKKGLSKRYILQAADNSLQRLQTDYIDLYQSHTDDSATPLEETLDAYAQLIKAGKVRVIGASNYSAERLRAALDVSKRNGLPRYESLQPEYNLYDRAHYEKTLEEVCVEQGLGVISYYSLASGFLTGKYRSAQDLGKSPRGERKVKGYLNDRGMRILDVLDIVAEQCDSTPARIAIAWIMARPSVTAPIASATSVVQLNDLIEATKLKLDSASMELLNTASG